MTGGRGQDGTTDVLHADGSKVYLLGATLSQELSSFLPYDNKNSTVNVTLVQKSTSVAAVSYTHLTLPTKA